MPAPPVTRPARPHARVKREARPKRPERPIQARGSAYVHGAAMRGLKGATGR